MTTDSELFERHPDLTITVVDGSDQANVDAVRVAAARLLDSAVGEDLADDRFLTPIPPQPEHVLAVAALDDQVVAYVGAGASRGRLQLDVIGDEVVAGHDDMVDVAGATLSAVRRRYVERFPAESVDLVLEVWGRPHLGWHDRLTHRLGMTSHRALHQMRCRLPVDHAGAPLRTRSFDFDRDGQAVVDVNNRAFASHPDQSSLSIDDLEAASAQPWFDTDGLRIYEEAGRVAGFCWTKQHPAHGERPAMGEIYVIAVDTDFHGRGLGSAVTAAGLIWLHEQGLHTGMLYVEADNEPALRTYRRLGFETHRTDTAWRIAGAAGGPSYPAGDRDEDGSGTLG